MKRRLAGLLLVSLLAVPAVADARSSVVLGFHFGIPIYGPAPYYYPPYYYYPYYYEPPPAYYYPAPALQAPAQAPAAPAEPSWYYCESARGYYPYVRECPGGWQRVPAAPPAAK